MGLLRVRNWDRWQTYRRDRAAPPWIKLHKSLLLNPEFMTLDDAQKWCLVALWMSASEKNGLINDDASLLQRMLNLEISPPLELFLKLQFLEKVGKRRQPTSKPSTLPLTRSREAEAEAEAEKNPPQVPPRGTQRKQIPYEKIRALWIQHVPTNPAPDPADTWTEARRAKLRRLCQPGARPGPDLDEWSAYFELIGASRFLTGRAPPRNGSEKPFCPGLDWFLNPTNMSKVLEGNYK